MQDQIICPTCEKRIRKGSTFCIGCGNKVPENLPTAPPEPTLEESEMLDEAEELPGLEESLFDETPTTIEPEVLPPIEEGLSWDESVPTTEAMPVEEDLSFVEETVAAVETETPLESLVDEPDVPEGRSTDMSWEEGVDEIKVGMPFKEIEPPRVYDDDVSVTTEEALDHLFPEGVPKEVREETKEAVEHLFPEGRGSTTTTFIDVVVGKPSKVGLKGPLKELENPVCPNCGIALSSDEFEYPPYVFEAMGKARLDHGEHHLQENEHEKAIESFEIAKLLFERAGVEKGVAESTKRVDIGYDAMAMFHFDQGDNHMKAHEFEWAIVQYRKARELYMFSTDAKKRARCSEKVREAYVEWGKDLETQGDHLARQGTTRDALAKYQEAAAKFREGDEKKRLAGLEKKIRKA
jgi:predicted negative regulator of RcsB-dependent stress response